MTAIVIPHRAGTVSSSPTILGLGAAAASITGTTNETTLATIAVPGGSMGPNGQIEIVTHWTYTSSANNKIFRIKLGATTFWQLTVTTNVNLQTYCRICNRNSAASQVVFTLSGGTSGFGQSGSAITTGTENTDTTLNMTITAQLANAGETIQLESYLAKLYRA